MVITKSPESRQTRVYGYTQSLKCTRKTLQKLTLPLSGSEENEKKRERTKIAGFTVTESG